MDVVCNCVSKLVERQKDFSSAYLLFVCPMFNKNIKFVIFKKEKKTTTSVFGDGLIRSCVVFIY